MNYDEQRAVQVRGKNFPPIEWMIFCPGCECAHVLDARWTFNGDVVSPTFTPSYLSRGPHGDPPVERVCHSFIKDGQIQFMDDSTHALRGQTVALPPYEKW